MRSAISVDLIYVEDVKNDNPIEHIRTGIKAFNTDPSEKRIYKNLEVGMETNAIIYVKSYYKLPYENGKLMFVEIDGVRYKINSIIRVKNEYVYLNVGEQI